MKTFRVSQKYWATSELYAQAYQSKARRALFGYMLYTGRLYDTVFGGAFQLLIDLESLEKGECYRLIQGKKDIREIVATTEVAIAGGFNYFMVPAREIRRTGRLLENLPIS